ncbi:hypothetical protein HEB94_001385 [Actinopolymorpha pittospori]|uniref:Uncharacterized protein n=1 Tax=Actinopolymorpha pittospori TaxID=648752 RepID=A0A927MQU6_9ACTN|nr:hypothetical protein [Actinopolymorpha pittospori]
MWTQVAARMLTWRRARTHTGTLPGVVAFQRRFDGR